MTKLYGQNEEILESYNFRAERVCLKSGSRHGGHTGLQYFFISKLRDMHSLLWPWHSAGDKGAGSYLAGMAVAIPILNVDGRRHTNNFTAEDTCK